MRFGKLVAVEKVDSRKGNTYWKFKCDCDNEKEIQTSHVVGGLIKSCGCLREGLIMRSSEVDYYDLQTHDPDPRSCKICNNQFFGFVGDRRVFCYNCSPRGASVADAHRTQKRAIKHILVEYKGGVCVECGYDKCEGALQFHHLDPQSKDFSLSHINPNSISMEELQKEVDKCIILCANCHAKKHFVDDKVGLIMRLPPSSSPVYESRKCRICESEFIPNNGNRYYCYSCSPYGIDNAILKRIRKKVIKRELLNYRGDSCFNCGYNECEGALHFHHKNPKEKEFEISNAKLDGESFTMEKIKREADKCDVLCANCHFELHYNNGDDFDLD